MPTQPPARRAQFTIDSARTALKGLEARNSKPAAFINPVLTMKTTLLLFCLSLSFCVSAQQKSTYKGFPSLVWPKLYDIQFVKAEDEKGTYDKPVFSTATKALNGKTVTLPGYLVPFENGIKSNHFMLSSLPLNACFFCGVGGPESVVEVHSKEPVTYSEKPVEIRGVLKLNSTNPDKMIYILENAELLGMAE